MSHDNGKTTPDVQELVQRLEDLSGALVVMEPREGLAEMLDILNNLPESAFLSLLMNAREERKWAEERGDS